MDEKYILGIDIGGTGMKGAIVDIEQGCLVTERFKIPTPKPSTPSAVTHSFKELIQLIGWSGELIGCGFPAIVKKGVACSAANIHQDWLQTDIPKLFGQVSSSDIYVLNDADAAGMAEIKFGKGKNVDGTVLMITIGTGLGSALFRDGKLVPNTEFGHFKIHGKVAEHYASNHIRKTEELDWEEWGTRFNQYLQHIERLFSPDLIILGGGVSKKFDLYGHYFDIDTPLRPATFRNNAGIIGAAMYAYEKAGKKVY